MMKSYRVRQRNIPLQMHGTKVCSTALLVMVAATMICVPLLQGGTTHYLTITLGVNACAEIAINRSTWTANNAGIGESAQTATDWGLLNNTGDVHVDVVVNITRNNGTVWNVSEDGMGGHNEPVFRFYQGSWQPLNETQQTFINDLGFQESIGFGLNVTMPLSSSTNQDQYFTITFVATPCSG